MRAPPLGYAGTRGWGLFLVALAAAGKQFMAAGGIASVERHC